MNKGNSRSNSGSKSSKKTKPQFICKYCGKIADNPKHLTHGGAYNSDCSNSPTGKHVLYDKGIQDMYYCKHCGAKNKNLKFLVAQGYGNPCPNSPTGKHEVL